MAVALGVDLGGTKIAAGVVDASGAVLERDQLPSLVHDPEALVEQVAILVGRLDGSRCAGLGVGAAGLVEHATGRYIYGPNTGLRDLDLAAMLTERTGLNAVLDNDANCAAWGEHRFGSGRGTRNFLCITLGTGIGGGVVIGGRPYRGSHGGAGEFGHMVVDPQGPMCGCGQRGCWEQMASGQALERIVRSELPDRPESSLRSITLDADVRGPAVTAAARDGDAFASEVVARIAVWVGRGLGSLVNVFDPEAIAVAGGMSTDWDLMADDALNAMRDQIEASGARAIPEVSAASLGSDAGVVGAAWLALERA